MAEIAGHTATVRMTGTSTAMTNEACTLVSGKTYRITNAAKRIIDYTQALTVKDNGVTVNAADISSIDYLAGKVTFAGSYTPTTPITMTGNYLPTVAVAKARGWSATHERTLLDVTLFGDTTVKRLAGLKDAKGSISEVGYSEDTVGADSITTKMESGNSYILEFDPDGAGTKFRRYLVKFESLSPQASPDGLVEDTVSWTLAMGTSVEGYNVAFTLEA